MRVAIIVPARHRYIIPLLFGLVLTVVVSSATAASALHLGVLDEALERPGATLLRYERLESWLRERLADDGIVLGSLVVAADPRMLAERLVHGEIDLVLVNCIATLLLQRDVPDLTPVLLGWQDGEREQKTVFFARRDSRIELMEDLRGQTLVLASPNVQAGGFVPRIALGRMRIAAQSPDPSVLDENAVTYRFVGSSLNQAYWVERERAAAGAFSEQDWATLPEHLRASLRIFKRTEAIAPYVLSVGGSVPQAVRERFVAAFEQIDQTPRGRAALEAARLSGFEPPGEADAKHLRDWRAAVERFGL